MNIARDTRATADASASGTASVTSTAITTASRMPAPDGSTNAIRLAVKPRLSAAPSWMIVSTDTGAASPTSNCRCAP